MAEDLVCSDGVWVVDLPYTKWGVDYWATYHMGADSDGCPTGTYEYQGTKDEPPDTIDVYSA